MGDTKYKLFFDKPGINSLQMGAKLSKQDNQNTMIKKVIVLVKW